MKYLNIDIYFLIFSFLISLSYSVSFRITDRYEKYCFNKFIKSGDQITISFLTTSYPKELFNVDLTYQREKYGTKTILYQVTDKDHGDYRPDKPSEEGYYDLCFYSKKGKEYYVSLEYYTLFEDRNVKEMATDKDVKNINNDIKEIKTAFENIQINARHLNDRKFRHLEILHELTDSIKRLTFLKLFTIAVLSAFQIYVIQKFFGKDKRVSTIKGGFSDKSIL